MDAVIYSLLFGESVRGISPNKLDNDSVVVTGEVVGYFEARIVVSGEVVGPVENAREVNSDFKFTTSSSETVAGLAVMSGVCCKSNWLFEF